MFKSIQQKLKDSLILCENETILSLIYAIDLTKKQHQQKKIAKEELAALLPSKKYCLIATSIYLL